VVVAKNVQGRSAEQEMLAGACREANPTRHEHAENVAMREQCHVSLSVFSHEFAVA